MKITRIMWDICLALMHRVWFLTFICLIKKMKLKSSLDLLCTKMQTMRGHRVLWKFLIRNFQVMLYIKAVWSKIIQLIMEMMIQESNHHATRVKIATKISLIMPWKWIGILEIKDSSISYTGKMEVRVRNQLRFLVKKKGLVIYLHHWIKI